MTHNVELNASEQQALDRIRSILAGAQGVNARSRVQLEALGRELGIPSERIEQLVRLASSPNVPTAASTPLTPDQRDLLRRGVLTIVRPGEPPFILEESWRELVAISSQQMALPAPRIEQTLHQERDALGAVLLGPEQALRRLLDAARQSHKLHGDTPETRRRLVRLAASLQIDPQALAGQVARPSWRPAIPTAVTATVGLILILAIGSGVWFGILGGRGRSNANQSPEAAAPSTGAPAAPDALDAASNHPPDSAAVGPPEAPRQVAWWWGDSLASSALQRWRDQWRRRHPNEKATGFPGPSQSLSPLQFYANLPAAARLGDETSDHPDDAAGDELFRYPRLDFLAICLHREPDPAARARLWEWFERQFLGDHNPPAGWPSVEQLRSTDALLAAVWRVGQADNVPQAPWRARLARLLQVPALDAQWNVEQVRAQWWRVVLARAPILMTEALQPPSGLWLNSVFQEAGRYVPAAEIPASQLAACTSLLLRDDTAWREHEALIEQVIASPEAPVVARIAEIYAATSDPGLQTFLQERLLRRIGSLDEGLGRLETVAAVRRALGLPGGRGKGEELRWEAARQVASRPWTTSEIENLQRLLDSARWCVLIDAASRPQAELLYQQWSQEPPRRLPRLPQSPASRADSTPTRGSIQGDADHATLANTVDDNAGPSPLALETAWFDAAYELGDSLSPIDRMRAIDAAADAIVRGERPTRDAAEALAQLLVQDKSGREIQHQRRRYTDLGKSIEMRLAIADVLLNAPLSDSDLQELVERLIMRRVGTTDIAPVRRLLHRRLLLASQEMLPEPVARQDLSAMYEFAGQSLAEYYRRLASLHEVSLDPTVVEPGQVLAMLARGTGRESSQQAAADWRTELAAAEYVAVNDLQRTTLMQRLWLQRRWGGEPEFAPVLQWLRERDLEAEDIVMQAACGQTAWLRCLLLELDSTAATAASKAAP